MIAIGAIIFYYYTGDIAELMVFNVAITDMQRIGIETYLRAKYGL